MNKANIKEWLSGFKHGETSVLDFLLEMKGLELKDEYDKWSNADEYINFKGELIKRYA